MVCYANDHLKQYCILVFLESLKSVVLNLNVKIMSIIITLDVFITKIYFYKVMDSISYVVAYKTYEE